VAKVPIARDFAPLVRTNGYHVFVTPEGDCNGLCVMKKTARGFTVRELGGGATNIAFAFRIVAKRKDLAAPRLPRVKLVEPKAPRPAGKPRLPRVPRKARKPSRA
jgi:hypothetical protein